MDLYEYGFRWYDAAIGRFTGVDPIADEFAWVNTYNYAENEPVANIDLHGLQKWPATGGANAGLNYIGEGFRMMFQAAAHEIDSWKASVSHTHNQPLSKVKHSSGTGGFSHEVKFSTESSLSAQTHFEQIFVNSGNNEVVINEPLLDVQVQNSTNIIVENSAGLDLGKHLSINLVETIQIDWATGKVIETQKTDVRAGNDILSASIYGSQATKNGEVANENGVELKLNIDMGRSGHEFSLKAFKEEKKE
jgi:uncharacterized protein RhaS with RHS repeats